MHDVDDSEIEAIYPDKFVCAGCFGDDYLKAFIEEKAASEICSYCGKKRIRKDIAAPVDAVIEHMLACISRRYGDAWANGASYDTEDGKWMTQTWDTNELLFDYVDLPNDHGTLRKDIANAFPDRTWSTHDPWSSTDAEILQWGWKSFVEAAKHRRRFFFTRKEKKDENDIFDDRESLDPGQLLARFGGGCVHSGLIKTVPEGTVILRCRPRSRKSEKFAKARDLGPPPPAFARQNRMSPAGIPMFYGSDNKQTTLAEMPELPKHYAIATFETLRPLKVLDLTNVRDPSIFGMSENADYDWLLFMNQFLIDFSSPIKRDDRIHIEYVPTQVITEYLRDAKLGGKPPVEGIKYLSARKPGGICYVLFIDAFGVEPKASDLSGNDESDERWRRPKSGYTLRLRQITHHTRP